MGRIINFDSNGSDITCMKTFDTLANPCDACDISSCPDRVVQNIHVTYAVTTEEEAYKKL